MKSPECLHIPVNSLKHIEDKIKEIWEMNLMTQDNQIKGECHMRDFVKSIEFYNEKFHKLERDSRKKERKIKELEEKTRKMNIKIDYLNKVIDKQEKYSRRNCILLHGVKESENEDTDSVVTEILHQLLQEKSSEI